MKKKILALSLILSLTVTALSGCNQNSETETGGGQSSKPQTSNFVTTEPIEDDLTSPDEWDTESESEREIKTSAETREELIAIYLKAFSEKDNEVLNAFRRGNYDAMLNDLCKALDEAGNLPEDINEIDLDPKLYEVYHVYNSVTEHWEVTYPLANGHFTFYISFNDYEYTTKTYSVKSIKFKDHLDLSFLGLSGYRDAAASGEPVPGGSIIEVMDITPYLD